ncbi:MAG: helix-turn-helix transcriptional regulator [Oscillospiraceae bacterium]|nr:helix-turn-helix transcriptional regulator [Oscillospiraceae bacterium]
MENNDMYEISSLTLPICAAADELRAQEGFFHADRILPYYVCDYVEEGAIYVTEDDTDYAVTAGKMIFLEAGHRHFGKREIERGTHWFYVHFYLADACPEGYAGEEGFTLPKMISPDDETIGMIRSIAADFHVYGASARINGELLLMLSSLMRSSDKCLSDRIAKFLASERDRTFSADALEKRFYLSYRHLAHVFRADKGMTMQQYHDGQKFAHAAALLRSTLLTVSEIARICGFSDALYFSRRFHRYMGVSPSVYRKNVKGMM